MILLLNSTAFQGVSVAPCCSNLGLVVVWRGEGEEVCLFYKFMSINSRPAGFHTCVYFFYETESNIHFELGGARLGVKR